jgi:hypothetical protein
VKLIEAGRVVNHIFLQQIWSGNLALLAKLNVQSLGDLVRIAFRDGVT